MIRFSVVLVAAGLGLLLAGALTSELSLVYAAIAVSVLAAVMLAGGVFAGRRELFGHGKAAAGGQAFDRVTVRGTAPVASGAAAPAAGSPPPADPPAKGMSGLGWPPGEPATDQLWARVDAELTAAGAAAGAPKLTRKSGTREVWDRVELELTGAARRNPQPHAPRNAPGQAAEVAADAQVAAAGDEGTGDTGDGADVAGPVQVPSQAAAAEVAADDQVAADGDERTGESADAAGPVEAASRTGPATAPVSPATSVLRVPGVPRYHRNECIIVRSLAADDVQSVTREAAEAAGCTPCRACQPDLALADAE